jgi:hypothetical protein
MTRGGASSTIYRTLLAGGLSNKSSIDDPIIFVKHVTAQDKTSLNGTRMDRYQCLQAFPHKRERMQSWPQTHQPKSMISLLTTALFEKNYYGQYKAVVVSNDQYRFATNRYCRTDRDPLFRDMCNSTYGGRPSPGRVGLWIALTTLTCIMAQCDITGERSSC